MEWIKKAKEKLKYHLVDTTAIIAESTPVYALFEKCNPFTPLSDDMSLNTRLLAAGLAFLGLSSLYSQGRDLSKRTFKITDQTKEKIQGIHDVVYNTAFTLAIAPPMYAVSQILAKEDLDISQIAVGTGIAMGVGLVNGWPMGYAVDILRDFVGLKSCERNSYPSVIRKRSSKIKKLIATGLVAATIGTTGLIYALTPDNKPISNHKPQVTIGQKADVVNYDVPNKSLEDLAESTSF